MRNVTLPRALRLLRSGILSAALMAAGALATSATADGTTVSPAAAAVPTTISPSEWAAFTRQYVREDGRVVDVERNGVSHSESQSYGLYLAVKADDQATFDSILGFTFRNMRGRGDRLTSWIYNPKAFPPITDTNNASDGDIMIAYSLLKAGVKWKEPRYIALAEPLVDDIGRLLLDTRGNQVLVRPAAFGFGRRDHQDGPVVNLSYYIYGAFLLFAQVSDRHAFMDAWRTGLELTMASVDASGGFAPDWITLREGRRYHAANGFARKSSYDAVRIPLFMALGGRVPARFMAPFDAAWNGIGVGAPRDVDLDRNRAPLPMNDPGYRAIAALTACAVRGVPIAQGLQTFRTTTYFASALHLMALSAAREHYPHCVKRAPQTGPLIAAAGGATAVTILAGSRTSGPPRRLTLDDMPGFSAPLQRR